MLLNFARHRLVKDTLVLFGVQVSGYILPLVTLPYLTRVLGPTNFGLLALGTALVLYFSAIIEYGFSITGTRQIAIVQDDPEKVSRVYSTIMACKLALLAACFLAMVVIIASVPKLRPYWPLYLVSFLQAIGWCLSPNWLLQGMQRIKLVAYSDYGAKIISVLLIFVLVHRSSDYILAAAIQSGGFLIAAFIGLILAFSLLKVRPVRPAWTDMRSSMIQGWPVFLSLASITMVTSSNTVILGMVSPPDQVGFLSAASRLVIAARALTNPITTAVYPYMSKLAAKSKIEALGFLQKQVLLTAAPFLLISLGMLFFGPLAVRILYGPKYAETGFLLQLMWLIPVIHAISTCFGTYYMLAFGHEKAWSKIISRMVVLNFITIFLLMLLVRPVRAIAIDITLMDLFTATSCFLFYRRTKGSIVAEELALPVA